VIGSDGILMDFKSICTIFEFILDGMNCRRKLAGFADGDESGI
jgi:hypothetical protein